MTKKFLAGLVCGLLLVGIIKTANASLVQWSSTGGGNGHWYDVVLLNDPITWTNANAAAEGTTYNGMQGYLASITSGAENLFVASHFTASNWVYNNTNGHMGPWIGGYQPDGSTWTWTSGEDWDYAAWETNQPSNSPNQDYVHYFIRDFPPADNPLTQPPTWNDHQNDAAPDYVYGYVVEFNPVPIPGTILLLGSGLVFLAGTRNRKKRA